VIQLQAAEDEVNEDETDLFVEVHAELGEEINKTLLETSL